MLSFKYSLSPEQRSLFEQMGGCPAPSVQPMNIEQPDFAEQLPPSPSAPCTQSQSSTFYSGGATEATEAE
eukprot:7379831-Prymnesium_polylepis.1